MILNRKYIVKIVIAELYVHISDKNKLGGGKTKIPTEMIILSYLLMHKKNS